MKGNFLQNEVEQLLLTYSASTYANWVVNSEYHFGGYAKVKPDLISFILEFEDTYDIPLEPIYTGKMFYGLFDLIDKDFFEKGTTIMALHTGGLQGNAGFDFRKMK